MKIHPVCALFPAMETDDFAALVADIKAHGVQVPVVLFQGQIIDGRHRWRACEQLGIECPRLDWYPHNGESVVEYVVSMNLHRRTLTASQRASVARDMLPFMQEEAREKQRAAGGRKTALALAPSASGISALSAPGASQVGMTGLPALEWPIRVQKRSKTALALAKISPPTPRPRDTAARAVGVSPRLVQDAKAISKASPELAAKVKSGEISIGAAMKRIHTPPPPPRKKQSPAEVALSDETSTRFRKLANEVHAVKRNILALAAEPIGRELRVQDIEREMKNVAGWLLAAIPFKKCPFRGCTKTCKACHGTGWVNEQVWENIPGDVKT